ncbi:MAG: type II secretion system F family protein [Planctomycetes bacterium]|nr:type II secretion system F family protein [Planctomycetota bacterium]
MTHFKYAAKESSGNTVTGTIEAKTKADAVQALRKQNLVIMKLDESALGGKKLSEVKLSFGAPTIRAKKGELVIFTRQLATMVGAGLSMLESLEVLGVQAESVGMRLCCEKLVSDVRAGSDLSQAMAACPKVFNHLYISMVKAGEVSGQMDIILIRLADYEEASEELTREIKSAMTYPVISMVLVLGITAFLMIGVVPSFKNIFESMDVELPAITKFTLGVSDWMRANAVVMFGGIFASIIFIKWGKKTNKGERWWDWLMLKLPVFGDLFSKVALARFSRTFSTLIRSGVPMLGVLDIVVNTSGNRIISDAVAKSKESVRNGNLLSEPLEHEKVFPPMVVRMIAIGERTGALETLLEKIAEFYDSQVKAQVKALTSLIEPLLISVMGIIVGGVVLSIFAPILNMVSNLSGQK